MDASPPTLSAADHRAMIALRDQLLPELTEALTRFPATNPNQVGLIVEWMYEAVNTLMPTDRVPGVYHEDVAIDDRCAAGHVDYARKFCLYLAQRAWGVR